MCMVLSCASVCHTLAVPYSYTHCTYMYTCTFCVLLCTFCVLCYSDVMEEDGRRERRGKQLRPLFFPSHRLLRTLIQVFIHIAFTPSLTPSLPPLPSLPPSLPPSFPPSLPPSLPPSRYGIYLSEQRQVISEGLTTKPSMSHLSKTIGRMWSQLPAHVKQVLDRSYCNS